MATDIDVAAAMRQVGVSPTEWVMLHGDAGVAAQLRSIEAAQRLPHLLQWTLAPGGLWSAQGYCWRQPQGGFHWEGRTDWQGH